MTVIKQAIRDWWDQILGTVLVAFACWLLFHDIQRDGQIEATTAGVAFFVGVLGATFIDVLKVKEAIAAWSSAKGALKP